MSTVWNKPSSELRTTVKTGITAGFTPSVTGEERFSPRYTL